MNYQRLHLNLLKYGRDAGYSYVCASYRPQLRSDPKYQQWQRLVKRASLLAMTPGERYVLQSMLVVKMLHEAALANPNYEPKFANALCGDPQQSCRRTRTCTA